MNIVTVAIITLVITVIVGILCKIRGVKNLFLLVCGIFFAIKCVLEFTTQIKENSFLSAVGPVMAMVLTATVYAAIASICFVNLFLPELVNGFVNTIFGLGDKYKVPPVPTDHSKGLIKRKEYSEALAELTALLEENPCNPELCFMIAEILGEKTKNQQKCYDFLWHFFTERKANSSYDLNMLMLLGDLAAEGYGDSEKVKQLMDAELKRKYSSADKKAIKNRLQCL